MKTFSLVLITLIYCLSLSCKDIPTFVESSDIDPSSENYSLKPLGDFRIVRDLTNGTAFVYLKYNNDFPYTGIEISVKNDRDETDYVPLFRVESSSIADSIYYEEMNEIPYLYNTFKARAYYEKENGTIYSDSLTFSVNQILHNFLLDQSRVDDTRLGFRNQILNQHELLIVQKLDSLKYDTVFNSHLSYNSRWETIQLDADFDETQTPLYYQIFTNHELTELIPINFSRENCIQTIDGKHTFIPYGEMTYGQRTITYSWSTPCDIEEFMIYRDDGGNVREGNTLYPLVEVARQSTSTGRGTISITFPENYRSIDNQIWLIATHNGEPTEFTSPFNARF